ncbi:MAG: hypothetical protein KAX49_20585 [Halanaerobiales bacterium]|nr:hypothetical protein [Halanaerobiales bacterium]
MKKFICVFLTLLLFSISGITVFASNIVATENSGYNYLICTPDPNEE